MNTTTKLVGAGIGLAILIGLRGASASSGGGGTGNITATMMTIRNQACTETPCTVSGTVEWKNIGDASERFTPALSVGNRITPIHTEIELAPGEVHRMDFAVNITETTDICPVPN